MDGFELFIFGREYDGSRFFFKPAIVERPDGIKPIEVFLSHDNKSGIEAKEFCQAVMDAAWQEGMRPTGFTDIKNETTAIKYHLEDMRTLVFKSLNLQK